MNDISKQVEIGYDIRKHPYIQHSPTITIGSSSIHDIETVYLVRRVYHNIDLTIKKDSGVGKTLANFIEDYKSKILTEDDILAYLRNIMLKVITFERLDKIIQDKVFQALMTGRKEVQDDIKAALGISDNSCNSL